MAEVLKKFGRYFLLDQIAQGGMAEIYRARLAAADGAGRLLVIKRIQAGFGANNEFLQMFKSEIKVTMGFNHPNIVQLYDFGEENQQPYIAMEFVDGKNLRQFLSRFAELKQTFPVDLASYIIEQAASGLHYAHVFKDKITGQPLNIVHRDISPQNILLAYEGSVKVIDFGIAKASTNSESTRAGVIKGKPSYLSPEQISGETLDGRCDIFALGIVLWELLTGRKLFAGENDLAVLKLIESCNTHVKPPSTLNPKVPKELDYIVLKALAKQREKRYQNGEELQRALHKFLYAFSPEFNPGDLSYYAKDLFKNEIVEDRKRIQKLNDKVEQLLAADAAGGASEVVMSDGLTSPQLQKREDTTTVVEPKLSRQSTGNRVIEADPMAKVAKVELESVPGPQIRSATAPRSRGTSSPAGSHQQTGTGGAPARSQTASRPSAPQQQQRHIPQRAPEPASARVKPAFIAAAAVLALAFVGPSLGIRIPVLSDIAEGVMGGSDARLTLEGDNRGAVVSVNGQAIANGLPATIKGIPVGTAFRVTVTAPGGLSYQNDFVLKKGEKRSVAVALSGDRGLAGGGGGNPNGGAGDVVVGKSVLLRLNISPGANGATIAINGRTVDPNAPSMVVQLDSPLELVADRPGFRSFRREFVLDSQQIGGLKEWLMDVQLEPIRFGFLTIRTTPSADATIFIEGRPWVKKTPLENEKVPIGTYSIKLANEVLGMEKTVNVTILEGKAVTIDQKLELRQ